VSAPQTHTCHACRSGTLRIVPGSETLHRVTSDAKAWPPGGRLGYCPNCGLAQTATTGSWHEEIQRIYEGYTIYHQGAGAEQSVFGQQDGGSVLRSEALIKALASRQELPATGRLLDVGCGNGSFLRSCSRALPGWELQGTEFDEKYQDEVEAIAGVSAMHGGKLEDVPGRFDVVSMIHVLEHIPDPIPLLRNIQARLTPGGVLFVQTPDCLANPVAMLVADHCSHFSKGSLGGLIARAGYREVVAADDWTPRELSVTARMDREGGLTDSPPQPEKILAGLDWLRACARDAERLAEVGEFGVFGTSNAATWLEAEIGGRASFFVDEDPSRIGRVHLGKPILAPAEISEGATVYVALPHPLAGAIAVRLEELKINLNVAVPPEHS